MENDNKKPNSGIGYKNSKYRPSVFIDANKREEIENHFKRNGYRTFNEYVIALIEKDMGIEIKGDSDR